VGEATNSIAGEVGAVGNLGHRPSQRDETVNPTLYADRSPVIPVLGGEDSRARLSVDALSWASPVVMGEFGGPQPRCFGELIECVPVQDSPGGLSQHDGSSLPARPVHTGSLVGSVLR
jgi:hypothetical protein